MNLHSTYMYIYLYIYLHRYQFAVETIRWLCKSDYRPDESLASKRVTSPRCVTTLLSASLSLFSLSPSLSPS